MKKIFSSIALVLSLAATSAVEAAANYTYEFLGYNGGVVTGSFTGTANGNLITNLSNISVNINGNALSGNLYSASYTGWSWEGNAVASFDGSENNFLFINSDYLNGNYNYTGYFYSVPCCGAYAWDMANGQSFGGGAANSTNWIVKTANTPEPGTLALFGLGLIAVARFRKNRA